MSLTGSQAFNYYAELQAAKVDPVEAAKKVLKDAGYVVLKAASYRNLEQRHAVRKHLMEQQSIDHQHTRMWAEDIAAENRKLRDRITFLYGQARAAGASVEDLAGQPWDR